jgi:hypothetical protein
LATNMSCFPPQETRQNSAASIATSFVAQRFRGKSGSYQGTPSDVL